MGAAERLDLLNHSKIEMRQSILEKSVLQKAYFNQIVAKQKLSKEIEKTAKRSLASGKENEVDAETEKWTKKQEKKLQKLDRLKERVTALAEQHPEYQSLFKIITADHVQDVPQNDDTLCS